MADTSFLDWPFFDDSHRSLAREIDSWAAGHMAPLAHDHGDVDETCGRIFRCQCFGQIDDGDSAAGNGPEKFGQNSISRHVKISCHRSIRAL